MPHRPARIDDPELLAAAAALLGRGERTIECTVRGDSMRPTLPDGCRIRVRCMKPSAELIGEIVVLAVATGTLLTHRLLAIMGPGAKPYVMTRGDGALLCDEPVPTRAFVGRVEAYLDGDTWRVVSAAPRQGWLRRMAAAGHERIMRATLAVHPGAAQLLATCCLRVAGVAPPPRSVYRLTGWVPRRADDSLQGKDS